MEKKGRYLLIAFGLMLLGLTFMPALSIDTPRSIQHSWNLGHIFLFAVWVLILHPYLNRFCESTGKRIIVLLAITACLGLLIEIGQTWTSRSFSIIDLVFNFGGTLLALSILVWRGQLGLRRRWRNMIYGLTAAMVAVALNPVFLSLLDELHMKQEFPLLADFESPLEHSRWYEYTAAINVTSELGDNRTLRVELDTVKYSGFAMIFFPRDWRDYDQLRFEVFNPGTQALALVLRIHDGRHYRTGGGNFHDRFNNDLRIAPGWNSLVVNLNDVAKAPRDRAMDMDDIRSIWLFSVDLPSPRRVYLDDLRLAKLD